VPLLEPPAQLISALVAYAVAMTVVGAVGLRSGRVTVIGSEGAPSPMALTAVTVQL
jgi:hypothetical protein